jgi:hypothetical protein
MEAARTAERDQGEITGIKTLFEKAEPDRCRHG